MKIALYQMNIAWENKEENLKKAETAAEEAVQNNADALFLPEMSLTGFSMNIKNTAESDNYTVERMKQLCRKYSIALGFGWVKACGSRAENCYTVLNRSGCGLSTYIKVHPFSYSGEDRLFKKGTSLVRYELDGTTLSTAICYDVRFPELFSGICKDGDVKAVVIPANWPAKRASHWQVLTQARAVENQIYILAVNCVGNIGGICYSGNSCIVNPNGEIVACANDAEGIIYADLDYDVEKLRTSFPVYKDRRNDFYKSIL